MSELYAVDASEDFITTVASHVENRLKAEDHLTVLFPNRRAVRFLENKVHSSLLLHMTVSSLEDFAKDVAYAYSDPSPIFQLDIDRYFMLHDILTAHPYLYNRLGGAMEHVFPWCVHLSNLFDEFDQYLIPTIAPFRYIDEVVKEAREILLNLDVIYRDYRRVIEEENLTFRGDIFRRLNTLKENLSGPFVLAGFSLLTEAQKSVFLHFFKQGNTSVFFHINLKNRHPVTNPYRLYKSWMDGTFWGKHPKEITGTVSRSKPPRITFHESFDTHGEAEQVMETMKSVLETSGPIRSPLDMGVVLPESQSLFPILYALEFTHLPRNVTLGFPFEKSVFYRLLNTLITLVLTYNEQRGFYHDPLVTFLSHPFIQSMKIEGFTFRETALRLESEIISRNLSFFRFETLNEFPWLSRNDHRLCRWLYENILNPFVRAKTLNEAGTVLSRIVHALENTLSDDSTYKLERQMVQSLLDQVLPNLTLSRSSKQKLSSPSTLCRILKHLILPLQIPFEGNPLEGIQVMGMLESRLLNFDHLFVLDVNEGILPRGIKIDPLFPPSLSSLVGLPSLKMRESLFQYNFFRLVDSTGKSVHIFYQQGVSGEEKRIRSRFVEQLLLEEEIKQSNSSKSHPIKELEASLVSTFRFKIPPLVKPNTRRPSFYQAKLEECLSGKISPTLLDEYLNCPHRFYLHSILKMEEETTIQESQSAIDVGQMVHRILQQVLSETTGELLSQSILERIRKTALHKIEPAIQKSFPELSKLRIALLKHLTKFRLNAFFFYMEKELSKFERIKIMGLEMPLKSTLKGYHLYGKADRIDETLKSSDDSVTWRIIDYKTGKTTRTPSPKLAEYLETFDFSDFSLKALSDLKGFLRSVQLPMYLFLFLQENPLKEDERAEAVLYLLGSGKKEIASPSLNDSSIPMKKIASLILYLINHMYFNESIAPYDLAHCPSCPYVKVCKQTSKTATVQR
jgi:CRISPR/Cas system-associated exonuclease Cas4 (RecB family)